MAQELNEETSYNVSLRAVATLVALVFTLVGMWFSLQADIAEARTLPKPADPEITRVEFDMKDKLIRQTIMATQEDVSEIKDDIKLIKQKLYE